MKVLKGFLFLLLAALVFFGFITAYTTVPSEFEKSARDKTIARLEQSGTVVDENYVNATIENAVHSNLHIIYRTAILIALAVAFALCMLSVRPPHDCGGINLFNPLALPLIGVIVISLSVGISLALSAVQGQGVEEFLQIVDELKSGCAANGDMLLITVLIPLALEGIFRGYIFSFLEKLHFSVAIVLSTVAYSLAAYYCVYNYASKSIGSTAAAGPALFIAMAIGFVLSVVTWRLRSCIPALVSHLLIANSAPLVEKLRAGGHVTLPLAIIVLAASLALLVFLPMLLAKRVPIFAYDYPFTQHHKRMNKWLDNRKKKTAARRTNSAKPAAKAAAPAQDELKFGDMPTARKAVTAKPERSRAKSSGRSSGKSSGRSSGKSSGRSSGKSSGGKKR